MVCGEGTGSVNERAADGKSGDFLVFAVRKWPGAPRFLRNAPGGSMAVSRILSGTRLSPRPGRPFVSPAPCGAAGPCGLRPIPGDSLRLRAGAGRRPVVPCSVLHHTGFFLPPRLRSGRWALTPPFQPCRPACAVLGGVFSATLSVGRGLGPRPPACSTRRVAMRCPDFPPPRTLRRMGAAVRHR